MIKLNLPTRFDNVAANDGVWETYYSERGDCFGSYKTALVDSSTDRWLETMERLADEAKAAPKKGFRQASKPTKQEKADKEASDLVKNFIELSLVDWDISAITADGKNVPFTKEAAIEVFDHRNETMRWLISQIMQFASNVENFQPVGQKDVPEKN